MGLVADEIKREILDKERGTAAHRLPIERVQHGVTGAVRRCTAPPHRRSFAVIRIVTAEGTLIDFPVVGLMPHVGDGSKIGIGGSLAARADQSILHHPGSASLINSVYVMTLYFGELELFLAVDDGPRLEQDGRHMRRAQHD